MRPGITIATTGLAVCFSALILNSISYAAVVMTGTRVIFPASQNEKTIQLQNKDSSPGLVQVWLDQGDEKSTPDTSDAPFLANPQIFKIAPNKGQMVRLIFTGDKSVLPTDRESLFYLNFSETPAIKSVDTEKNKLIVVFKNRLKVFYRPNQLPYPSSDIAKYINYQFKGTAGQQKIIISNNSPYYANLSEVNLINHGNKILLKRNSFIAPLSSAQWDVPTQNIDKSSVKLSIGLINDYGISNTSELMQKTE